MKQRLLTQLQAPQDLDYVQHFQLLAAVNLEIRRHGPTAQRLLRKAILETDVGNFAASLSAAQDAVAMDGDAAETHYHLGKAYALLALVKAEAIPPGPGEQAMPGESCTGLILKALESFRASLRLNPQDEESGEDLGVLAELLERNPSEADLAEVLRNALR